MKSGILRKILILNIVIIVIIVTILVINYFRNNKENINSNSTKTIVYKDMTYTYPSNYFCKVDDNIDSDNSVLIMYGVDMIWHSFIIRYDRAYVNENYKYLGVFDTRDTSNLEELLHEIGHNATEPKFDNIDGTNLLIFKYSTNDQKENGFIIYAKTKSGNIYEITLYNEDNSEELNKEYIREIINVLKTAEDA